MRWGVTLAAMVWLWANEAMADCPSELRHTETEVLLARTCVSERGWRIETDDCAAIYEVALARAAVSGDSLRDAICDLSPHLHGGVVTRAWLQDLRSDGERPRGLGAPWERLRHGGLISRREAWMVTVEEARELIGGFRGRVCELEVRAWGSDADLRRRRLAGLRWVEVECGDTFNHFGRVYRRVVPD